MAVLSFAPTRTKSYGIACLWKKPMVLPGLFLAFLGVRRIFS